VAGRNSGIDAARNQIVRKSVSLFAGQKHGLARCRLKHLSDLVPIPTRDARERRRIEPRREHRGPAQHIAAMDVETRQTLLHELPERLTAIASRLRTRQFDCEQRIAAARFAQTLAVRLVNALGSARAWRVLREAPA
jgi:hypothetical protein